MKIFHPHGTKERLFEMMKRVGGLNESKLPHNEKIAIINKFIEYADDRLSLMGEKPKIKISTDGETAQNMKSFGKYTPENDEIMVVVANRNLADVLRTLAHELVHFKQNKMGKLSIDSNKTGSDDENEANALAGVLMRDFSKKFSEIFE